MFLKEVPISQFMKNPVMTPSQTSSSVDDIIGNEYTKAASTYMVHICACSARVYLSGLDSPHYVQLGA